MSKPFLLHLNLSVAELLAGYPACIPLFLRKHMACVGCQMAPFDTLDEAARNYGLPAEDLLAELRAVVESSAQGAMHV
jgi:hybrid cluster-associated redox disulfide protein